MAKIIRCDRCSKEIGQGENYFFVTIKECRNYSPFDNGDLYQSNDLCPECLKRIFSLSTCSTTSDDIINCLRNNKETDYVKDGYLNKV